MAQSQTMPRSLQQLKVCAVIKIKPLLDAYNAASLMEAREKAEEYESEILKMGRTPPYRRGANYIGPEMGA